MFKYREIPSVKTISIYLWHIIKDDFLKYFIYFLNNGKIIANIIYVYRKKRKKKKVLRKITQYFATIYLYIYTYLFRISFCLFNNTFICSFRAVSKQLLFFPHFIQNITFCIFQHLKSCLCDVCLCISISQISLCVCAMMLLFISAINIIVSS